MTKVLIRCPGSAGSAAFFVKAPTDLFELLATQSRGTLEESGLPMISETTICLYTAPKE